jgi:hypothetical protein
MSSYIADTWYLNQPGQESKTKLNLYVVGTKVIFDRDTDTESTDYILQAIVDENAIEAMTKAEKKVLGLLLLPHAYISHSVSPEVMLSDIERVYKSHHGG